MDAQPSRPWHALTAEEAASASGADLAEGLKDLEVVARRTRWGENRLSERKGRGPLVRFLLQFSQPLVYVLLAASAAALAAGEWVDALVIFGVVFVNAVVGFIQEAKALDAIGALARSLKSEATVLRGGARVRLPSTELVPGDLVFLQSGDRVPADLRLLKAKDLRIDESALTGESVPSDKDPAALAADAPLADRRNMAYSSTLVSYGAGSGVVVGTGDGTEIGRISELIADVKPLETPLTRKIADVSRILLFAVSAVAAVCFGVALLRGYSAVEAAMASVALAVGAIPEGLPAAVTIMLAVGVSRMARRRAIVRKLPAVETLGGTTVICSDKTGTLTENQMTVQAGWAGGRRFAVSGGGYRPEGEVSEEPPGEGPNAALAETLRAGLLCNDAALVREGELWTAHGDPTEAALLVSAAKGGLDARAEAERLPRADAIPFESERGYMATLHRPVSGGDALLYVKGSLEALLPRCVSALSPDGGAAPFDPALVQERAAEMARRGLRVLAFARRRLPAETAEVLHRDAEAGLQFLGLQGMLDPPRESAARAVAACLAAGIRVKMITGDHAETAAAIAERLGLEGERDERGRPRALAGRDLEGVSDEDLVGVAARTAVFARVTPEHKHRLVQALQRGGDVVAMTGDGVNDAPALRRADIGVAMGLGGTEVAREAADMVLADDRFATIAEAVEEGRAVFDNLLKFLVWTLPTNGAMALVIVAAMLAGAPLPILPLQILWVNMAAVLCLGLTLVFEPAEGDLMRRAPRDPRSPLLGGPMLWRIVFVSALLCAAVFGIYEWLLAAGATEAVARTGAVAALVAGQAAYLFNSRSLSRSVLSVGLFSNPWVWYGAGTMAVLQAAFTHVPIMNRLFETAPLSPSAWAAALGAGAAVGVAVAVEKAVGRRLGLYRAWGVPAGKG